MVGHGDQSLLQHGDSGKLYLHARVASCDHYGVAHGQYPLEVVDRVGPLYLGDDKRDVTPPLQHKPGRSDVVGSGDGRQCDEVHLAFCGKFESFDGLLVREGVGRAPSGSSDSTAFGETSAPNNPTRNVFALDTNYLQLHQSVVDQHRTVRGSIPVNPRRGD